MPHIKDGLLRFALRHVAPVLISLLGRSMRIRWVNDALPLARARRGENCVFCFWHSRLLLMPFVYQRYRGSKNICAMASRSQDGEIINRVLKGFNFETARGSSSRGGEAAIMEMVDFLTQGLDAAVTPDGPRGPRREVQPGVIMLSQLSGVPIVPATYDFACKKRLRSWDRFIVPFPFSRGVFVFGDPIYVDRNTDDAERECVREKLQAAMLELDLKAAKMLGIETVSS